MATKSSTMIGTVVSGGRSEKRLAVGYDLNRRAFIVLRLPRISISPSISDFRDIPSAQREAVPFAEYVPDDPSVLPAEVRTAWEAERRRATG